MMNTGTVPPQAAGAIASVEDPGSVTPLLVFPTDIPRLLLWNHCSSVCALDIVALGRPLEEVVFKTGELSVEKGLLAGCSFGRLRAGCGRGGLGCNGEKDEGWGMGSKARRGTKANWGCGRMGEILSEE